MQASLVVYRDNGEEKILGSVQFTQENQPKKGDWLAIDGYSYEVFAVEHLLNNPGVGQPYLLVDTVLKLKCYGKQEEQ